MKKIILSLLIIFISLPAPSWADGPYTVTGTVYIQTTIEGEVQSEPAVGETIIFTEFSNWAGDSSIDTYAVTDTNGQFSLPIPKKGYIHITPIGASRKLIPVEAENKDLGDIIIQADNSLDEAVVQPCTKQELKDLNANIGRYLKGACQPIKCKTPRYVLKITNDEIYSISDENDIKTTNEEQYPTEEYTATCEDQVDKPCTLTTTGVKNAKYIANGTNDIKCIPSECDTPRYKLEYANSALAQCVDQNGQDCYENVDDPYALDSVYEYDAESNKLNCVSASCIDGYTLDKKTKKCITNKCPCGQDERNNECVDWKDTGDTQCKSLPSNAATAERACDGDQEYCKILTCNGDEYKNENLHEFELNKKTCISRVGGKCTPTGIDHATDGKYKKSDKQYKLFCAVTKCDANYVPSDDGKKCIPSGCTNEQATQMKNEHATSWKLADNKQDCIPTKCECGYGTVDGQPVGGTCNTPKWSWDDAPPPEPNKIECQKDNASKAYMDCRENGKAYCRVYECDTTSGFNLYGNECIQGACKPTDFPNALYVKRVGGECKIQECETGYQVNKKDNTCDALKNVLSKEESQERIKELQANEDALEKNEQKLENKLWGAAGIAGAGIGGQMLATGIAQRRADAEAERDMTAYLATFKCKYGNKKVDSGNKEIELPGANDQKYSEMYRKYKELADELKISKASLGMKPGIESEEILDISNLYSNGNIGGANGAYTSLADALSGDSDAQKALKTQKGTAVGIAVGGGLLAAGAVASTVVGNVKAHKDAPEKPSQGKYDAKRGKGTDGKSGDTSGDGNTGGNGTVATGTKTYTNTASEIKQILEEQTKDTVESVSEETTDVASSDSEIKQILEEQTKDAVDSISEETTDVTSSDNEEWPFRIKIFGNRGFFYIDINALGKFYYDCGDGMGKQELVVSDFKNMGTIECEIVAAGTEIKLGGRAEKYNNDSTIVFYDSGDEWEISGSLGAIFPTLDDGSQPVFMSTFEDCKKLTGSIPADLFKGISGRPAEYMFDSTFWGCSGLTGPIPPGLFAGIQGPPAEGMFYGTFRDCSGLDGPIPPGLFAGIQGPPAEGMFESTFENCSKLSDEIPANLFEGIQGPPAEYMFDSTFFDCSNLSGEIPKKLFAGISGKQEMGMFHYTFAGCSKLSGEVGPDFFGKITPRIDDNYVDSKGIFDDAGVTFKE